MDTNKTNDFQETGTLTIRSKVKDGSTSIKIKRFCGT
jgi:hypothetical protein